jgi:ADP-heptose:LPS heptosyltransferase
LEKNPGQILAELKKENYDVVIDLHHNLRSLRVKMALFKPSFSFHKLNLRKWLWVNLKINLMPDVHIVDRYLETLKPLGVQDDGQGLEFYPCDCDAVDAEAIPEEIRGKPYIVLSIGGTHFTKKMPVRKWIELGKTLPLPMVIAGGKEDMENGWHLSENLKKQGKAVWNAAGLFSLGGSAHLIRQSAMVISHDTGMMHIAAAFQKPVVAIWGNTSPGLGMYPFRTTHYNMEVQELSCRPCSKIGYNRCPRSHFDCMQKQDVHSPELQKFIHQAIEKHLISG